MNSENIYITGDTHADFRRFGAKHFHVPEDSVVIICGDFGGVWNDSASERFRWRFISMITVD